MPNESVRRLQGELLVAQAKFHRELVRVQRELGISEVDLKAIAQVENQLKKDPDKYLWRVQIEEGTPQSIDLDMMASRGLMNLLSLVNPTWLRAEAQKRFRLGAAFLQNPLHLVNGVRVGIDQINGGPQRFARVACKS